MNCDRDIIPTESASLYNKTGETLMFLKIASKFMNLSNLKGGGASAPKVPPPWI